MPRPVVVAIDGPSGAGKSSQSKRLAKTLGADYLDTGAMYRAVCWAALERDVELPDHMAVAQSWGSWTIKLGLDPSAPRVYALGRDITEEIRSERISLRVSEVATNMVVRPQLVAEQQRIVAAAGAAGRSIVLEGRDTTTVVAPHADVRILLTAGEQERVRRRAEELAAGGTVDGAMLARTADHVTARDAKDSAAAEFMRAADGVMVFDSSASTPENTARVLREMVQQATGEPVPNGEVKPVV